MFYGFKEGKRSVDTLRKALDDMKSCFTSMFASDNLVTFDRNLRFLGDRSFMSALESTKPDAKEQSIVWRLHVLAWAAEHARALEGDFVECGVFRGFSPAVLAKHLDFGKLPRQWYLYDTFEGIPEDQQNVGSISPEVYDDPALYAKVCERFAEYPNIRVVKGRVPEVLADESPERVALLHIDMNSAVAEVGALEVLFPRVVPGGIVVLDDYGWMYYQEQTIAEDEFFGALGYRVLELPTGQGLVLKR